MSVTIPTLEEINRRAISLLVDQLGLADTYRFLGQFHNLGDCTRERDSIFENQSADDIWQAMQCREKAEEYARPAKSPDGDRSARAAKPKRRKQE